MNDLNYLSEKVLDAKINKLYLMATILFIGLPE